MNREEFEELIEQTHFEPTIKKLFMTSYEMGYNEGQIRQMTRAINALDSIEFEMVKK